MPIRYEARDRIAIVTIDLPEVHNAVDGPTAAEFAAAFRCFESDADLDVAILTGADGTFCAGTDLKSVAAGRGNRVTMDRDGPMGPSRMWLGKPLLAAVEGHAVAGGLEPALCCDLRIAARDAVFGVYCRRWGVPLIDGGTVRLPRLVGMSHAMDLILTGRGAPSLGLLGAYHSTPRHHVVQQSGTTSHPLRTALTRMRRTRNRLRPESPTGFVGIRLQTLCSRTEPGCAAPAGDGAPLPKVTITAPTPALPTFPGASNTLTTWLPIC